VAVDRCANAVAFLACGLPRHRLPLRLGHKSSPIYKREFAGNTDSGRGPQIQAKQSQPLCHTAGERDLMRLQPTTVHQTSPQRAVDEGLVASVAGAPALKPGSNLPGGTSIGCPPQTVLLYPGSPGKGKPPFAGHGWRSVSLNGVRRTQVFSVGRCCGGFHFVTNDSHLPARKNTHIDTLLSAAHHLCFLERGAVIKRQKYRGIL
jgi:hypothetical protein